MFVPAVIIEAAVVAVILPSRLASLTLTFPPVTVILALLAAAAVIASSWPALDKAVIGPVWAVEKLNVLGAAAAVASRVYVAAPPATDMVLASVMLTVVVTLGTTFMPLMVTLVAAAFSDTLPPAVPVIATALAAAVAPTVMLFAPEAIVAVAAVFIVSVPVKLALLTSTVPPVIFISVACEAAEPVKVKAALLNPLTFIPAAHCEAVNAIEGVPVAKDASMALTLPAESIVNVLPADNCPIMLITVALPVTSYAASKPAVFIVSVLPLMVASFILASAAVFL
ncbi:MAG: hypothetical protein BWY37_02221 [Firmicutes bacterium ADurb.Bin262]|nr:MAG: hypothetical protein BWY37_02221 [Firmicutes bacterium ADurb.Bin262]